MSTSFLTFSDGAKFALIARNLFEGNGFTTDFSFWSSSPFGTGGIPYLVPYLMSLFFKLFGAVDFAAIAFSFTFYIFLIVSVFLLARKLYGTLVGVLSAIAVAANFNFYDYATSGASETLVAFEIVIALYFLSFKKLWINLFGFVVIIAMYFTRPQAFIFMAGVFLFWIINKLGTKRGLILFFALAVVGMLVDKFIIYPLSFKYTFLTPVFMRGLQSILTYSSFNAVSDGLRGGVSSALSMTDVFKKVFYNLYNFYKAIPEILNPYLFTLFVIGLFQASKEKIVNSFKISSLFIILVTFLVTALTIPFYRYLHPVVPLVYIIAIATLVEMVRLLKLSNLLSVIIILVLCVGQTIGYFVLDSRFEAKRVNIGKPPVYAQLSYQLKEVTTRDEIIVTNLDTWGSWYGERKTIWFPLDPDAVSEISYRIDAIYLTSYKIDDENYYMGEAWRDIFENPTEQQILPDYELVGEYVVAADETYERQDARAVLLRKKSVE